MKRCLLAICIALALSALGGRAQVAGADEDGPNLATTQVCDLGMFLQFMRADGTVFTNTRECAVYADNGGTLYPMLDLRLAVGLDAQLCLPSAACQDEQTRRVIITVRNIPKVMLIRGTLVNLAGFGFSPDSTVTVRYAVDGQPVSEMFLTHMSGFFSLTGSKHVAVPCGVGDVTFTVTDNATGLVRMVTPELLC